ncbi:MAG: hypothetical protein DSY42_05480 [Aquifex sp.]|nr:MAG: hypothetical protein DSY42_05480 [Aquifex sp.]
MMSIINNTHTFPRGVLRYPYTRGRNYYSLFPQEAGTREIPLYPPPISGFFGLNPKSNSAGLRSLSRPSVYYFNTFDKLCNQKRQLFAGGK